MRFRSGIKILVGSTFAVAACTSFQKSGQRGIASSPSEVFSKMAPKRLGDSEVASYASSQGMDLTKARVIKDNSESLQSKIEIIRGAKETLDLVYYIYSDDFSSSLFTTELIAAAKRKVQVNLLVDFITNYDRLDLFKYMEQAGAPNLKVKFYGMPTESIRRGAVYQTVPCEAYKPEAADEESCRKSKEALIAKMGNPEKTWFSSMYLTGLYGKNQVLLGTSTQVGGQFDPKAVAQNSNSISNSDAKKLGKLMVNAKVKNDLGSKIKLSMAMTTQGGAVGQIVNEFTGRLPLKVGGGDDWNHLSDYTHHKLIMADGLRFQLGGRNIEDSYHTDKIQQQFKESKGKYTFMDTDFYGEGWQASEIRDAYKKLFNFDAMVGDLTFVDNYVPNEYNENTEAFQASIGLCLTQPEKYMIPVQGDLEACVNQQIKAHPAYKSAAARLATIAGNMKAQAARFANYKAAPVQRWMAQGSGPAMDQINLNGAKIYYIENLSFSKGDAKTRTFDPVIGREMQNGKGIHALWARGIENACAIATADKPQRVILHSAYFFLPTPVLNAIAKAINGAWDCHNVRIQIITNSPQTTDLAPVNLFARNQLRALFRFYYKSGQSPESKRAKLEYLEYMETYDPVMGRSLHTKISVLGEDMIIGSANADVRSYAMDTNNGVFIRGAKDLVKDYMAYIDDLGNSQSQNLSIWDRGFYILKFNEKGEPIFNANGHIEAETYNYADVTDELLHRQTDLFLNAMADHWLKPKPEELAKLNSAEKEAYIAQKAKSYASFKAKKPALEKSIKDGGEAIEKLTDTLLQKSGVFYSEPENEQQLEKACAEFDKNWQTL